MPVTTIKNWIYSTVIVAALIVAGFFVFSGATNKIPSVSAQATFTVTVSGSVTTTTSGGYTIHRFTGNGTFVPNVGPANVEYLIVAGGGGGGNAIANGNTSPSGPSRGGGGGAGGLLQGTTSVNAQTYSIVVGAGGSVAVTGGNSSFAGMTAIGGGAGGSGNLDQPGFNGGSGGGGSSAGSNDVARPGGSGVPSQGNSGGAGALGGGRQGGGGGGAGGQGFTGNTAGNNGFGGSGILSNISGNPFTYSTGGRGGTHFNDPQGYTDPISGAANTGNGGGGAPSTSNGNTNTGATGGSGVVIIRYLTSTTVPTPTPTPTPLPPPSGEPCGNRNLIGNSDVFWGDPPPINLNQFSPRLYPDVNQVGSGLVRFSLEGEFPSGCAGLSIEYQVYIDGTTTLVATVSGNLNSGSSVIPGNLGSWQWYVDWNHTLGNGSYRFRVTKLGGGAFNSILSTNVLIVSGIVAPPPPPPPSCSLSFSPIGVILGQSSTATWTSTNDADGILDYTCTGNIGSGTTAANGSIVTNPTTTQTCTMTAINVAGTSTTCTAGVTVTTPAPTVNISASPTSVAYNGSSTVTWSTTNATSCTASGGWTGSQAVSGGTQTFSNLTTNQTYTLTCTGAGGSTTNSATVTVGAPPALTCSPPTQSNVLVNTQVAFSATGGTGSYSWSASGGSPSSGTGQNFSSSFGTSGAKTVTVTSGTQSSSCQVDVVALPPTSAITCNGVSGICQINYNDPVTIDWSCTNAVSGVVANSQNTSVFNGINGPQTIQNMITTTVYALTCTNSSGATQTSSVEVNVPIPVPPVALITCNGQAGTCQANSAGSVVIGWVCANSASGTVTNSVNSAVWSGVRGYQVETGITGTQIYTLTCNGAVGIATGQVQVDSGLTGPGPQSTFFLFTIPNPFSGQITTLSDLLDALILFLYYIAGPIVVIMIILSGLYFLFGRGEPSKIQTAKRILLYAIIGLIIILIGRGFIALIDSIIALGN